MPIPRLYGTDYSIWLSTPTGQRIALIDRFNRLQYTLTANGIGVMKIDLGPAFDLDLVQEDSRLDVYRQVPGGARYRDGEATWLIRDWDQLLDSQGRESIVLLAYTASELLDRAIVAYASGSSQARKSSVALDDLIKALVRENLGSLATDTDRDLSTWLLVEADASAGPTSSKSMAWRQLLPTLRELAQDADDLGTPVFFDVVRPGDGDTFTLQTYTGQRGADHGQESDKPVVLSPRNGTLGEVRFSTQTSNERNVIYVGGQGEESDRTVVTATDADRISRSPFNRREYFVDARNTLDAGLEAEGQAALKHFRSRKIFAGRIRDTQAVRYGREYNFGDRLVGEFKRQVVDVRLDAVEVMVEGGLEEIWAELRVEEAV